MNITIDIRPDLDDLAKRLADDFQAGLDAGMLNLVEEAEAIAVGETPVRTSNLVNSITSYLTKGARILGVVRATADYAVYVHEGTGVFGPLVKPITPKTKKALYWPGARHPVRSVKGMKPNKFMDRAKKEVDRNKTELFREGIMNYLRKRGW